MAIMSPAQIQQLLKSKVPQYASRVTQPVQKKVSPTPTISPDRNTVRKAAPTPTLSPTQTVRTQPPSIALTPPARQAVSQTYVPDNIRRQVINYATGGNTPVQGQSYVPDNIRQQIINNIIQRLILGYRGGF
jgi:hypothetical protein